MKILVTLFSLLLACTVQAATPVNLTAQNTVLIRGEIDELSVSKAQLALIDRIKQRGKANYPIYLVLDSPGGSIMAGLTFIDFAKTLYNVRTVSIFAASMASGIVEAIPGRRLVTEGGILMFHRAKGGFEGQFEEGELESELALWKTVVRSMEQKSADRVGLSLSAYKDKVRNEWWIYGSDNVVQKTADEIVSLTCSQELMDQREIIVEQVFIFQVKQEFSGCPLFRTPMPPKPGEEEDNKAAQDFLKIFAPKKEK